MDRIPTVSSEVVNKDVDRLVVTIPMVFTHGVIVTSAVLPGH
jgi:hypothetical protein